MISPVNDSLVAQAERAIASVVEGSCPLCVVELRIHDGRGCCPCCGDGYVASNGRLEMQRCPEHGRDQHEPAPTAAPALERVSQLAKLAELRSSGVLTEEEFQTEKARILGS